MRKGVSLVVASLFAIGITLTGCGSSDKTTSTDSIDENGEQTEVLNLSIDKDDRVDTQAISSSSDLDSLVYAPPRYIYKTGQTVSYAVNDDGDTQVGLDRELQRDDENEIVIDNIRGLIWQDNSEVNTNEMSWSDAVSYCENLTLAGRDDWRLPNDSEIMSIVDYSQFNYSIDPAFENTVRFDYWLSNSYIYDPTRRALRVSFNGGYIDVGDKAYNPYWSLGLSGYIWTKFNVRCVTGVDKNDQKVIYTRYNSDIVIDTSTRKMWQDNRDTRYKKLTFSKAIEYCNNLTLGGYDDWRLPNKNELLSILDTKNFRTNWKLLDKNFYYQNLNQWSPYISSTTFVRDEDMAWSVHFGSGRNYLVRKSPYDTYAIRCVRDLK